MNQVIRSQASVKINEMKLCSDGEHDRGDSPVHTRQVRDPQGGRAQPDQAGCQAGQAQVRQIFLLCSLSFVMEHMESQPSTQQMKIQVQIS